MKDLFKVYNSFFNQTIVFKNLFASNDEVKIIIRFKI